MPFVSAAQLTLILAAQNQAGQQVTALQSQVDRLSASVVSGGQRMRAVFSELQRASFALDILGAATIAPGVAAIHTAADFESSMAKIVGLTNTPKEAIAGLRQGVLDMAKVIPRTPGELGEGLYQILSSGVRDTAVAMEILTAAAKASVAGLGSTKDASKALTAVINAYGQENYTGAKAADILTVAVRDGTGEADALTGAIGRVLPYASELGVTFEEVAANLATFTNIGVSADEAATGLRQVLQEMIKPSAGAVKEATALGLSFSDLRKELKEKGLLETLNHILTASENLGTSMQGTSKKIGGASEAIDDAMDNVAKAAQKVNDAQQKVPLSAERVKLAQDRVTTTSRNLALAQQEVSRTTGNTVAAHKAHEAALKKVQTATASHNTAVHSLNTAMEGQRTAIEHVGDAQSTLGEASEKVGEAQAKLGVVMEGNTGITQDQIEVLAKIFPNIRGLADILGTAARQGKSYAEILADENNALGANDLAFQAQANTLNFKLRLAWSNLQVALVNFGTTIIPIVEKVVSWITQLIQKFQNLPDSTKQLLMILSLVGGGLLLIAGGAAFLVGSLGMLALAVTALGVSFGTAALIILGIPLLIAAIITGGYLLIKHWDEVKAATSKAWAAIKKYISEEIDHIIESFDKIAKPFIDIWNMMPDWIKEPIAFLVKYIGDEFGHVADSFYTIGKEAAKQFIKGLAEIPLPGGTNLLKYTKDQFGSATGALNRVLGKAVGGPITSGMPYLVGERGPELFVPSSSGNIIPNGAMGHGATYNINVAPGLYSEREVARIIRDIVGGGGLYGALSA